MCKYVTKSQTMEGVLLYTETSLKYSLNKMHVLQIKSKIRAMKHDYVYPIIGQRL